MEKGWRLVTLDGKRMRISIQDGRRAKDPRDPNATSATPTLRSLPQNPEYATPEIRSVFIANLSTAVTEEQLKDTMAQFGPVATVEVFTRLFTREPTGFATVTFATTKAAKMCALQSGQLRLENQSVYVHMDHAIPNYKADGASATLSEVYMGKYHTDASRGHTPSFPALTQLYPDPLIRPEDMPASPTSSNMGMSPSPDAEYQFSSFGATTTTTNATNADAASTTTTTAAAASTSPASNARADHLPMQQNNSSTHTTPHHHHHRRHHDDERTRGRDRHHSDSDHHHHRDDREREPSSHRRRSGERSGRWSRSPSRTRTRTHAHGHSHAHGHNRDESRRYSSGSFDGESRHQHDDTRDHGYGDHASRRDHTHSHRRNHRGGGSRRGGRSGSRGGSRVGGWNSPSSSWNSGGRAGGDVHGHMRSPISGTSRSPYTPQPHGRYGDRGDHIASPLQSAAAATPPLPPPQLASSSPSTSTPTSHQPLVVLQIPGPFPRRVAPSDWLDFLSEYHPVQARFNTRHSVWRVSFRDKRDADAAARHCLHSQLLGYRLSRPRVLPQRSNSTSDNASHDSHNGTPHSKQQHQQQQQQQQRGGSWGAHAMTTPPTPTANGGAPGQQWGAAAATSWGSTSATPTTPTTPTTPHQQRHAPARKGLLPAPGSSPLVTSPATWVTRPSPSTPMTTAATTPMTTMTPTTGGGGGAGVYDGTTLTAVPKALAALLRNKLGPGGIVEGEGRGSDDEQHASGGAGGARESAHGHEHVRVMTWKEACKQRLSHLLQRSFVLRFSQSVVEAEVRRVVENHFAAIARRQQQLAQEEEDARAHLATPKAVSITSLSSLTIERRKDLPASTRSRLPSHTRARVTGGVRARARRTAVAPTSHVDGARRRRKPIAPQAGGKGDWWADMELASSSSSDEEEEQEQGDDMEEDEEEEEEDVMEDEDEEDESDVAHDHDVEFQHRAKRRHSRRFDSTDDEDDDGEGDDGEWAVAWKRSKTRTSTLSSLSSQPQSPTAHVVAAYETDADADDDDGDEGGDDEFLRPVAVGALDAGNLHTANRITAAVAQGRQHPAVTQAQRAPTLQHVDGAALRAALIERVNAELYEERQQQLLAERERPLPTPIAHVRDGLTAFQETTGVLDAEELLVLEYAAQELLLESQDSSVPDGGAEGGTKQQGLVLSEDDRHQLHMLPILARSFVKQRSKDHSHEFHSTGCARTQGYYFIEASDKRKKITAGAMQRQLQVRQTTTSTTRTQRSAVRKEHRALQLGDLNELAADLVKANQFKRRRKLLRFARSMIHEWGLFAQEPIDKDELVIEYVGEIVRQTVAEDRERRYARIGIGSSYLFRIDEDYVIDATRMGSIARFINHSCDANCYAQVVSVDGKKRIGIYSKRPIAANEEITYDYKFPREEGPNKIPCFCGARTCRGTLN